jgi:cation transport regulator
MPYQKIEDLPNSVRDALPSAGQKTFLAVFNSAWSGDCKDRDDRETRAFRVAWGAIKKSFHQNEAGEWVTNMDADTSIEVFSNAIRNTGQTFENTTVQTLNRWIPDEKEGHYFEQGAFEQNPLDWEGIPVVLASDHPDLKTFETDPETALTAVDGSIVGEIKRPRIEVEGHPRFMSALVLNIEKAEQLFEEGKISKEQLERSKADIPRAIALWESGRLSESSAFFAKADASRHLTGGIRPNHILVFEEDMKNHPRDKGTLIANKDGEEETEVSNIGKEISSRNLARMKNLMESLSNASESLKEWIVILESKGLANKEDNMDEKEVTELKQKVTLVETERDAAVSEIKNKDTEIANLKTRVEAAEGKLTEIEQKAKDSKFDAFVQKHIAPGEIDTPEKKIALRTRYDADPLSLLDDVLESKNKGTTGEQGSSHVPPPGGDTSTPKRHGMGSYDPLTDTWK